MNRSRRLCAVAALVLVLGMGLTLASCVPLLEGDDVKLWDQQVRLTFLHTADIHSRLIQYDFVPNTTDQGLGLIAEAGPFGGATRLAAVLKRERKNAERVIHVDSGDSFQGAPIFNAFNGEAEYRFLSEVGLNASALGNHEFDDGAANFVQKARQFARFPILSANYQWDPAVGPDTNKGSQVTEPYTIVTVKGVRVGIIGMANESTVTSLTEGGNSIQAKALEQNEAARKYVEFLRPLVDVIVIISHLGLTEDQDIVNGYQAYYRYGDVKQYLSRADNPWTIFQWFGPVGQDDSVVEVTIPGVSGIDVIFGGHLHVVLNPPQQLVDPSGRHVVLSHSGAFAKYVGRLDVVLQMPHQAGTADGAEVLSTTYRVFPLDSLWCSDDLHAFYKANGASYNPGQFIALPNVQQAVKDCVAQEDVEATNLLQPYIESLDYKYALTSVFAYAPSEIDRTNSTTGGDSPLGNLTADSMRVRQSVEAEVALTNSLGIRDNLYAGPLTQESMYNVFPFENTINIMYLGGDEMQELFDFVTDRSAERGCNTQAQISGVRFTMDCAQSQLNNQNYPCNQNATGDANGAECPATDRAGRFPWQCLPNQYGNGGRCYAHTAENITINGKPLQPHNAYRIAVNNYIAAGGSGFQVLKRNTTRQETGISLRDSIVSYMQDFCSCDDINAGKQTSPSGQPCGIFDTDHYVVTDGMKAYCQSAQQFQDLMHSQQGNATCVEVLANNDSAVGGITDEMRTACTAMPGPQLAKCTCRDALQVAVGENSQVCGNVTQVVRNFCIAPTKPAIGAGTADGRINRRVK